MNYIENVRKLLSEKIDVESDLLDLYVLLVLVKDQNTSLEDVHDAWAVWKNRTKPDHRSLIPFKELTSETQLLDKEYTDAIISVAGNFNL